MKNDMYIHEEKFDMRKRRIIAHLIYLHTLCIALQRKGELMKTLIRSPDQVNKERKKKTTKSSKRREIYIFIHRTPDDTCHNSMVVEALRRKNR